MYAYKRLQIQMRLEPLILSSSKSYTADFFGPLDANVVVSWGFTLGGVPCKILQGPIYPNLHYTCNHPFGQTAHMSFD